MPHTSRWPLLLIIAGLITIALLAAPALAQSEADGARSSGGGVVGAFFVSKRTDPVTGETSIELLGTLIIWFLLALSMASIGLIGHMALTNQRKTIAPDGVVDQVGRLIKGGKFREVIELTSADVSYFSKLMHAGLSEASHGFASIIRAMEQAADEQTTSRLRRIEYLNVLGQVSPMIGLFGTVYGMILAFQAIVLTGGDADPIMLAGGISTALTTTFWGLVVAIPALAGYAIIRNRIDQFTTEATSRAEELLNHFRPRPTRGSGKGADGKPAPRPAPSPSPTPGTP